MSDSVDIQKLIKNKRVCVVGPATYLNKLDMGSKIDKYDIIVRFNKGHNLINNPETFGSRTDILYHCICQEYDNGGIITKEMVEQFQIVFSFPVLTKSDNCNSFRNGNENEIKKLPKFINKMITVNKENYLNWEKEIGCRPNTGIIAILDILSMKPKELYITGFTLFKDGYSKLYRPKIDNIMVTEENSKFKVLNRMYNATHAGAHDQYKIFLYLKKVLLHQDNVVMDKILIDILNFDDNEYAKKNNLTNLTSRELFIHYLYYD